MLDRGDSHDRSLTAGTSSCDTSSGCNTALQDWLNSLRYAPSIKLHLKASGHANDPVQTTERMEVRRLANSLECWMRAQRTHVQRFRSSSQLPSTLLHYRCLGATKKSQEFKRTPSRIGDITSITCITAAGGGKKLMFFYFGHKSLKGDPRMLFFYFGHNNLKEHAFKNLDLQVRRPL